MTLPQTSESIVSVILMGSYGSSAHLVLQAWSFAEPYLSLYQVACSTRARSKSRLARPYICRLISFKRCTCPSTCP
jgi:hypothetical protein